jgi:hypothetical protein
VSDLPDVARLKKYSLGLQSLLGPLAGSAGPVEGNDGTYTVLVTLAADGAVSSIQVDEDWKRKVRPEALGSAIMAAYNAAVAQQVRAWTIALTESDWEARADQLRERIDAESDATAEAEPPAAESPRDLSQVRARSSEAIAADLSVALDGLGAVGDESAEVTGTGAVGLGKLTITIAAHRLVSCVVEPVWAMQRTGGELTEALGTALSAARADLAEAAARGPSGRIVGLLDEALANLNRSRS